MGITGPTNEILYKQATNNKIVDRVGQIFSVLKKNQQTGETQRNISYEKQIAKKKCLSLIIKKNRFQYLEIKRQ